MRLRQLPLALALAGAFAASGALRSARAQVPDLLEVTAQYMPGTQVGDPPHVRPQVTTYDVTLNAPIPLGEKTFVIPGVAYHVESVSFDREIVPGFVPLRAFHAIDVPVLFVQLLPSDWSLSLRFSPGLAGDFESIDEGMVRLSGLVLATHALSERLVLGGGLLASWGFGSLLPLPALYTEWRPFGPLQIEAFIPAFVNAKVAVANRFEVGYRAEIQGNQYAVRDERITGAPPCAGAAPFTAGGIAPAGCVDNVAYSVITLGPLASLRLFETVWWTVHAGNTVYRRFDPRTESGEVVAAGAQRLPNTFFFRTGLTWRIPMGE